MGEVRLPNTAPPGKWIVQRAILNVDGSPHVCSQPLFKDSKEARAWDALSLSVQAKVRGQLVLSSDSAPVASDVPVHQGDASPIEGRGEGGIKIDETG